MKGNPADLFEEMDAMFGRLFFRVDCEFMTGSPQTRGYSIPVRNKGVGPDKVETGEIADDIVSHPRVIGEPVAEIHYIGDEVIVIADLPGITLDELRLDVKGNLLVIDAGDADHHYRTSVILPPVDAGSMEKTLKNGVLEVTFRVLPG